MEVNVRKDEEKKKLRNRKVSRFLPNFPPLNSNHPFNPGVKAMMISKCRFSVYYLYFPTSPSVNVNLKFMKQDYVYLTEYTNTCTAIFFVNVNEINVIMNVNHKVTDNRMTNF